jgi:hypothetical protein
MCFNFAFSAIFEPGFTDPVQLSFLQFLTILLLFSLKNKISKYMHFLLGFILSLTWLFGIIPFLILLPVVKNRKYYALGFLAGSLYHVPLLSIPVPLNSYSVLSQVISPLIMNPLLLLWSVVPLIPVLVFAKRKDQVLSIISAFISTIAFPFFNLIICRASISGVSSFPERAKKFLVLIPVLLFSLSFYYNQETFFLRPNYQELEAYSWVAYNTPQDSKLFDGLTSGNLVSTYGRRENFGDTSLLFMGYAPDIMDEEYQEIMLGEYRSASRRLCNQSVDYIILHMNPEKYFLLFDRNHGPILYSMLLNYQGGTEMQEDKNRLIYRLFMNVSAGMNPVFINDEIAIVELDCTLI